MFRPLSNKACLSAVAALAAAGAALVPAAASAQSYGYGYNQPYGYNYSQPSYSYAPQRPYDRCETLRQGRTGAGGLVGAGIGAVAGSQLAARGRRTEGSILGGVLGAVVGASVGRASNDNCYQNSQYDYRYAPAPAPVYGGYGSSYDNGYYADDGYDRGYDDYAGYDDRYADSDYSYGQSYSSQYECRSVESRSRTPDGRLVTTYREVC